MSRHMEAPFIFREESRSQTLEKLYIPSGTKLNTFREMIMKKITCTQDYISGLCSHCEENEGQHICYLYPLSFFLYQALQAGRQEYSDNLKRSFFASTSQKTPISHRSRSQTYFQMVIFLNKLPNLSFANGAAFQKTCVTPCFLSLAHMHQS